MTLTPQNWTWEKLAANSGWLKKCPVDRPVIWQAILNEAPAIQSHLASLLSPAERSRLADYLQAEDQLRFLTGRGLLRLLVGAHLNLPPGLVQFGEDPFGKPFVMSPAHAPTLHFNVAHSGKLVLLAFHSTHEVGVDVEEVRPNNELAAIARQVFGPEEYSGWLRLPPVSQLASFHEKWTRQEARLKALGIGFTGNPDPTFGSKLTLFDLALPEGYQGAACLHMPAPTGH